MNRSVPLSHRLELWDMIIAASIAVLTLSAATAFAFHARGLGSDPQTAAGVLSLLFVGLIAYGSFVEPKRVVTNRKRIPLPGHGGLRIAVASDFHVGPLKRAPFVAKVVEHINALEPDMILLPGDFLYDEHSDVRELAPLERLRSKHGTFAIVGNHDTGKYMDLHHRPFRGPDRSADVTTYLENRGVRMLRNATHDVHLPSGLLRIAGIDDVWPVPEPETMRALQELSADVPTILLSHEPDVIRLPEAQKMKLIVSGHTHGGQIRLPGIGPLLPIPHTLGRWYDRGLFDVGPSTQLFITHGVGETLLRSRLFAAPEVVILEC